jgi:hypothetical protein
VVADLGNQAADCAGWYMSSPILLPRSAAEIAALAGVGNVAA